MQFFIDIYDFIVNWLSTLTFDRVLAAYWFMFIIVIPRYYILDWAVVIYTWFTRKKSWKEESLARFKLYADNPFVTIIVPGKDEGNHIYKLSHSLQEQTYKNFELVIVNDGSEDYSSVICNDLHKNGIITRTYNVGERGGKASAANLALMGSQAKYIVHLDADSSLDRDAIEQVLMPFYTDDMIKAVGGCVKVRNSRASLCASFQALEYLESIMLGRMVTSKIGIYHTISGAFGAFDMQTLKQVGGWDIGPGLDGDITQKFRKAGWKVTFNNKAVCLTNVPFRFFNLYKQRLRWSKSLVRFRIRKHRDILNINSANFNISNFISNAENIFFNFIVDFVWLFYIIQVSIVFQNDLLQLIAMNFVIMFPFRMTTFLMVLYITERPKEEFFLIKLVPFLLFYNSFMRIVRIIASVKEVFFFSSYKDNWNPKKSSIHARISRM